MSKRHIWSRYFSATLHKLYSKSEVTSLKPGRSIKTPESPYLEAELFPEQRLLYTHTKKA